MANLTILSTLSAIEDAINRDEKGDALAILQNARDVLTADAPEPVTLSPSDQPRFLEHATGEPLDGLPSPGPCPFCRTVSKHCGIVTLPAEESDGGLEIKATYHVQCDYCGAEGAAEFSQLDAAVKWNAATASSDIAEALKTYTWATIESKNLLRCISIAADHGESVDDDLRPALGCAIDGVARLLACVSRAFEHIDSVGVAHG